MKLAYRAGPILLFAGLIAIASLPGHADEKQDDPKKVEFQVDPLKKAKAEPPVNPDELALKQVTLPSPKEINYSRIVDRKPLASTKDNPDEWNAYLKIINHTGQVPVSALKQGLLWHFLFVDDRRRYS
jgi:hypothetical protein